MDLKQRILKAAEFDEPNPSPLGDTSPYNFSDARYDGSMEENSRLRPLIEALAEVARLAKAFQGADANDISAAQYFYDLGLALANLERVVGGSGE